VSIEFPGGAWLTRVGVMARRGFDEEPLVYLHVDRFDPDYDISVQLAAHLIEVSDQLDGWTS
jgi:hypothetical protein